MPSPLGYTLLTNFENLTGFVNSGGITTSLAGGGRQALGTNGLRIQGTGSNISVSVSSVYTTSADISGWNRIAFAVDMLDTLPGSEISSFQPRFVVGANIYQYRWNAAAGAVAPGHAPWYSRGKRWLAFPVEDFKLTDFSGASIKSVGAGTAKRFDIPLTLQIGNNAADVVVDALVVPADHRPTLMFTFDDANGSQYTDGFPAMQAKGWPGTIYLPSALINLAGKLTTAQINAMIAAGWSVGIDSMDDDGPLTRYPTLAESITALNANRTAALALFGDTAGAKHVCYSYGAHGYPQTPVTYSTTCDGSTTLNVGGSNAYSFLSNGMRVFGTGVPAGTYVVKPLTAGTVEVSQAVTAGTKNITFVGNVPNLAVTCNGTTTVTMASTTNLFAGLEMVGYTVPTGTTIVSVDSSTQITVSAAVPATCVRANFSYTAGEFWPSKVADALIAAGYQSGRHVNGNQHIFSGWGLPALATMGMYAISIDDTGARAAQLAQIEQALRAGSDMILYMHQPASPEFGTFLDSVAALVTTYNARVSSIGEWGNRISSALPIS